MIDYSYKELFEQDSIEKQLNIISDDISLTNADIREESMELHESICEEASLVFGGCESSCFKVDVLRDAGILVGSEISVAMLLDGAEEPFSLGRYKIISEKPSNIKFYKTITAYDALYGLASKDISSFWNNLPGTLTVAELRNNFFAYLGIETEETMLVNDRANINRANVDKLSALEVAKAICEINGVFGRINREGIFVYQKIGAIDDDMGFYPGSFPGLTLYPTKGPFARSISEDESLSVSQFTSVEYEEYVTSKITGVSCELLDGTLATYGTAGNVYQIKKTMLVSGMHLADANNVCANLFEQIKDIEYNPVNKVDAKGNPCIEVGDALKIYIPDDTISVNSYVLSRTITGIMSLVDGYAAKGTALQPEIKRQTSRDAERETRETLDKRIESEVDKKISNLWSVEWVPDREHVGRTPMTFYCIEKKG